ncbi:MAG: hypothetical protein ABR936_13590 [Bacteroidota bacterium]|jgi:hypothetical protein
MVSGRQLQLTKQIGEYLVASELCRRNYIATTFTGNVPDYDIIASSAKGFHVAVQVKTIRKPNWQFDMRDFADIQFNSGKQTLKRAKRSPLSKLILVLLLLDEYGKDKFYIMEWKDLRANLIPRYKQYLKKHNGRRPKKPDSYHTSVSPLEVSMYDGNWKLFKSILRT